MEGKNAHRISKTINLAMGQLGIPKGDRRIRLK
jgi:hypothetical protein